MENEGQKISVYVLTYNSERLLQKVLAPLQQIADDLLIIDSGSTDKTKEIAEAFNARFIVRPFTTFKEQRNFAHECSIYDWVLAIDSDEVVSEDFVCEVAEIKRIGFEYDAYAISRFWIVQGVQVHSVYPIDSPDRPIRLVNKTIVHYGDKSNHVHESVHGYDSLYILKKPVYHFTFDTPDEIKNKLHRYSKLAAMDMYHHAQTRWYFNWVVYWRLLFSPFAAWYKWYIRHKGFKDGRIGKVLAKYAYQYTRLKYKYYLQNYLHHKI